MVKRNIKEVFLSLDAQKAKTSMREGAEKLDSFKNWDLKVKMTQIRT